MSSITSDRSVEAIYNDNLDLFRKWPLTYQHLNDSQKTRIKQVFFELNFNFIDYQKKKSIPFLQLLEKSIFRFSKNLYYTFYTTEAFEMTTKVIERYAEEKFEVLIDQDKQGLNQVFYTYSKTQNFLINLYKEVREKSKQCHYIISPEEVQEIKKEAAIAYYNQHIQPNYSDLPPKLLPENSKLGANAVIDLVIRLLVEGQVLTTLKTEIQEFIPKEKTSDLFVQFKQAVEQIVPLILKDIGLIESSDKYQEDLFKQILQQVKDKIANAHKNLTKSRLLIERRDSGLKTGLAAIKENDRPDYCKNYMYNLNSLKDKLVALKNSKSERENYNKPNSKQLALYLQSTLSVPKSISVTEIETAFQEVNVLINDLKKIKKTVVDVNFLEKSVTVYYQSHTQKANEFNAMQAGLTKTLEAKRVGLKQQLDSLNQQIINKENDLNYLEKCLTHLNKKFNLKTKSKPESFSDLHLSEINSSTSIKIEQFLELEAQINSRKLETFNQVQNLSSNPLFDRKSRLINLTERKETYEKIYLPILKLIAVFYTSEPTKRGELVKKWSEHLQMIGDAWNASNSKESLIDSLFNPLPADFYWHLEITRLSLLTAAQLKLTVQGLLKELSCLEIPPSFEANIEFIKEKGKSAFNLYLRNPTSPPDFALFFNNHPLICKWPANIQFLLLGALVFMLEDYVKLECDLTYREMTKIKLLKWTRYLDHKLVKRLVNSSIFSTALSLIKPIFITKFKVKSEIKIFSQPKKYLSISDPAPKELLKKLDEASVFCQTTGRKKFNHSLNKWLEDLGKELFNSLVEKHNVKKIDLQTIVLTIIEPLKKRIQLTLDYITELNTANSQHTHQNKRRLQSQQANEIIKFFKIAKELAPIFEEQKNENYWQIIQMIDDILQNIQKNPAPELDKAPFLPWLEQSVLSKIKI
jgi:hypothetical protein